MEFGHRWHCSDAFASKLRQLLAFGGVNVDEAVHIANAESLYAILRILLPLCS
jgi:hypothetical protein|tara:strand:- start:12016 stop:12174 length:159 start_codon:yes stop_codon:yes gene_type:complete